MIFAFTKSACADALFFQSASKLAEAILADFAITSTLRPKRLRFDRHVCRATSALKEPVRRLQLTGLRRAETG